MKENNRLINIEFNKIYRDIEIIYDKKKFKMIIDVDNIMYFKCEKNFYLRQLNKYINKYNVSK